MRDDNPKHNPLARRKMRGKWIGGVFVPYHLLMEAQRRRIEYMMREAIVGHGRLSFWQRIKAWLKNLWRGINRK
jgi:hypothetical protein